MKTKNKIFLLIMILSILMISSISFAATKLTLYVGNTKTVKPTTIKSVKSSNKKVATVAKSGKITAKKKGTATITITGKNKKKYTYKVTVKNPSINKTKITI